jgi:hypothetical protein
MSKSPGVNVQVQRHKAIGRYRGTQNAEFV